MNQIEVPFKKMKLKKKVNSFLNFRRMHIDLVAYTWQLPALLCIRYAWLQSKDPFSDSSMHM